MQAREVLLSPWVDALADPDAALRARGFSRETAIWRDAQGRWYEGQDLLAHPQLERAFDGWIERAEDGRFCLKNAINWAYIRLEGPAYWVRSLEEKEGSLQAKLSGQRSSVIRLSTFRVDARDESLWCEVLGDLPARLERSASAQLAPWLHEDAGGVYLSLSERGRGPTKHYPPRVQDPMKPMPALLLEDDVPKGDPGQCR